MRPVSSPPLPMRRAEPTDALEPGPGQMPAVPAARRLVRWSVLGFIAAGATQLVVPLAKQPPAKDTIPLVRHLMELLARHNMSVLYWSLLVALGLLALGMLVWSHSWLQWRRSRVRGAIALRLRPLRPDQIRVRARWSTVRPWVPARIRVRYPTGTVQSDPTAVLAEMFLVEFGLTVNVQWAPRRDGINIHRIRPPRERGPDPTRLEDESETVGKLHATLTPLLPGLDVDQTATRLDESGSPTTLVLRYQQTTKDISVRFRSRVQSVLEAKVPSPTGAWAIRWRPEEHTVVVSPSEPIPEYALNEGIPAGHNDRLALPLGLGSGARLLAWRPLKYPHLLLAGSTGGGKTSVIRTLLVMALLSGWRVWICDPKQTSFQYFRDWAGVERLCITGETIRQAILDHRDEMQRTYDDLLNQRITHDQITPLLLIFDEVTDGLAEIADYVEENFDDIQDGDRNVKLTREIKRAENAMWRVTRKGREAARWQVLGLQRPDTRFIPGEARDNLMSRAAAGVMRSDGAEMVFEDSAVKQRVTRRTEDPDTGEIREEQIAGRITIDFGNGPEPMQSLWTPDPAKADDNERALLERLKEQVADAQIAEQRRVAKIGIAVGVALQQDRTSDGESSATVEDADVATETGERQVAVKDLQAGQWILLELDDALIAAEVLDIDVDADGDMVMLGYCTAAGEAGGYEIDADALISLTQDPSTGRTR